MKKLRNLLIAFTLFCLAWGCTQRDAATVGAMVGRTVAMPIGTVAVALDETVKSTGDIVRLNPRYDNQVEPSALNTTRPAPPPAFTPVDGDHQAANSRYVSPHDNDQTHYYRAEVLVKTRGPANIQSIDFAESRDITKFWN